MNTTEEHLYRTMWIIAVLCQRAKNRTIRIPFSEVLQVSPRARIERYEDPDGQFIDYRLRDD